MNNYLEIRTPYGTRYLINSESQIIRTDIPDFKPSQRWTFRGLVSVRSQTGSTTYSFKSLFSMTPEQLSALPLKYKNGHPRFTGGDVDHGTPRSWGNTVHHGIREIRKVSLL